MTVRKRVIVVIAMLVALFAIVMLSSQFLVGMAPPAL
jgi:hypothetical protein